MSQQQQYVFSLNGENWSTPFDTRDAALAAALKKCSGAVDPPGTVFVGELATHTAFADSLAKILIQEMRARARGNDGDARYLASVTPTQLKELDANIERTVLSWLQKNQLMAHSLKVEKISEHVTPAPHRGLTRASPNGNEVHDLGVGEFPG